MGHRLVGVDVTDRQRALASAREREERQRQVLESLGTANAVFDRDCRLVLQNGMSARLLGKAVGDSDGHSVIEVFGEARGAAIAERLRRVMTTTEPEVFVSEFELPTGRAWFRSAYHPVADATGAVVGVQVISQDVTEQKLAERALHASEERFRLAFEQAPTGIVLTAPDGRFLAANHAFARMLGYEVAELPGLDVAGLTHPDDVALSRAEMRRMHTAAEARFAKRYLHRDGRVVWADVSAHLLHAADGTPAHFITHVVDVTERRAAELALAEEKARLAVTLRSIGDGVITTDTRGHVVLMSGSAERLTGYRVDEAAGRPLEEIFHIVDARTGAPRDTPVREVLRSGEVVELASPTELVSRDGQRVVIADSGAPIKDEQGAIIGVVVVFRDVTEKERLVAGLQQAARLESIGVLAGGIAHDFNNLLAGLYGYVSMARQASAPGSSVAVDLDEAIGSYARAKALTEQLLTFAKGGIPARAPCALGPLVEATTRFALSGTNVRGELALPADLWTCNIDRNQIGQVLDNLVINARQAMPQGGVVRVAAENVRVVDGQIAGLAAGAYVRLRVEDRGAGIAAENLPRIFDPFFTTKASGSGLGLATAYSIVRKHDGMIVVSSELGRGTVFEVFLPTSLLPPRASSVPDAGGAGAGTVLVMDDEPVLRNLLARMLTRLGYTVVATRDGGEAIAALAVAIGRGHAFVAAVLDLTVRDGMGGKDAAVQLLALDRSLPLIASSGYSADPILADPERFGFRASLPKPYQLDDLRLVLQTVVRSPA